MKIHILRDMHGYIVDRILGALVEYSPPSVKFVDSIDESDIVVITVSGGYHRRANLINRLLEDKKKYSMIQYILYSSHCTDPNEWLKLWRNSELVWSYLPLDTYVNEKFNFYFAPFGVDDRTFYKTNAKLRRYFVMTSGQSWMINSVRETYYAARHLNKNVAHLGSGVNQREGMDVFVDITDKELRDLYNDCRYISCLRHTEGFEMPGIEGLICGARPIVYDQPHFRNWYGEFADYIPETGGRDGIINAIINLFSSDYREVSDDEIRAAKDVFNWQKIITGFWKQLMT